MESLIPYATSLNKNNAYWMARFSKEVYKKTSENNPIPNEKEILISLKSDDKNIKSVTGESKNSAQAALIEHKDYLCITFRGTDETLDWLDNINAFPVQEIFGKFHRGFWQSTNDVWDTLFSKYKELSSIKKRPLFLTGHSLGGAMASIAASKLIHEDLPFISVYTFGQPRALERETSRLFNIECKTRYFRFQNNNDIVSRVPARLMGYSHVGTCIYISENKKLHNDPGFWFQFLDAIEGALEAFKERGIDGIEDHNIDKYLQAISNWDVSF